MEWIAWIARINKMRWDWMDGLLESFVWSHTQSHHRSPTVNQVAEGAVTSSSGFEAVHSVMLHNLYKAKGRHQKIESQLRCFQAKPR